MIPQEHFNGKFTGEILCYRRDLNLKHFDLSLLTLHRFLSLCWITLPSWLPEDSETTTLVTGNNTQRETVETPL